MEPWSYARLRELTQPPGAFEIVPMPASIGQNHAALQRFFKQALAYCEEYEPDYLEHFRQLGDEHFTKLTRRDFFGEYVWVVYVSGFSVAVIRDRYPRLKRAFKNFDVDAVAEMTSVETVLKVFGNRRKAECVVKCAKYLATVDFDDFKRRLRSEGPTLLKSLPGIGEITYTQLARNIGLASLAKNDTWIQQIVSGFGYAEFTSMIDSLATKFDEKPGVVDFVLWQYCSDEAWKEVGHSSLKEHIGSL